MVSNVASGTRNPFLSRVALELRRGRPAYPDDRLVTIHREVVGGRPFVRLWFLTPGCTHDRRGHCTMCNYGVGVGVRWDAVLRSVASELAALSHTAGTLLLSPSGSMFDEREVPADVRRELFGFAACTGFDRVLTESRPESVSADVLAQTIQTLRGKELALEMGLESSDSWVLRWCVNKGLELASLEAALAVAADLEVATTLNVSLGTAFLSSSEALADAVAATRWGLAAGASNVVLFPLLVRRWTVLAHLYDRGRYAPPSLWSLVEALRRLGPTLVPFVSIAWYRDYSASEGGAAASMEVAACPSTCPVCVDDVLAGLDAYRDKQSFAVVEELSRYPCECRTQWQAELTLPDPVLLAHRVRSSYEILGREVLGERWWDRYGGRVIAELPEHR